MRAQRRADRQAVQEGRPFPWWWLAGGLVVLGLVGRGVVGATQAPAHPATSPSAVAVAAATGTPPVGDAAPSSAVPAPAGTPSAAPTPPTVAPTSPSGSGHVVLPRATATASPSSSASATPSRTTAAATCSVSVATAPFWGGYNATITVKNIGTTAVTGWRVSFRIGDRQRLVSAWGATLTATGTAVQGHDAGYDANLPPGGTSQFGFQAQFDAGAAPVGPSGFVLNGVPCS